MSTAESNPNIPELQIERDKLSAQLASMSTAYNELLVHTNEIESRLDEAAALLTEIIKSGPAYAECTDCTSPTGRRIADLLEYVAQFQPEPHPVDNDDLQA